MKQVIIGIDFDNTIVSYDSLIYEKAIQRDLILPSIIKRKKIIRDAIRELQDGDIEWQKIQAVIYGPEIDKAKVIKGVKIFFNMCKKRSIKTFIISHKTEFSNHDSSKTNLRAAALKWMEQNKFFEPAGFGLSFEDVYFESTRAGKVARINNLNCTHFIDDLEETFLEPSFPVDVEKILYEPHIKRAAIKGMKTANSWKEIRDYFFSTNR